MLLSYLNSTKPHKVRKQQIYHKPVSHVFERHTVRLATRASATLLEIFYIFFCLLS